MMNQSAGSEVVGTLAPRCYEKIAKCFQRKRAFPANWRNDASTVEFCPLVAVEKSRNSPTDVGDPKRLAWA
jgi:hypothetical protein